MTIRNQILLSLILMVLCGFCLRELEYQNQRSNYRAPIIVSVTGEVAVPGTVKLPAGARVIHALNLCGGLLGTSDATRLELAKVLHDGDTLVVPSKKVKLPRAVPTAQSQALQKESVSNKKLDINQATAGQLETLPGIGPVLANRIVQARQRKRSGTFSSLEDLTAIRGIKRKTMVRLRPFLELEGK